MESSKREANYHIQENLNKIIGIFLIRNLWDRKAMGWYSQSSDSKNIANQEFNIQQNYPSKMREKLRYSEINKSWMVSLYQSKKYSMESFKLKQKDTNQ